MTTTVTVDTHDWPVKAQRINPKSGEPIFGAERVNPHSKVHFHLSDSMGLVLRELPLDPKPLAVKLELAA